MIQDDAVKIINQVERRCRGPWLFSPEIRQSYSTLLANATIRDFSSLQNDFNSLRKKVGLGEYNLKTFGELVSEFLFMINWCEADINKPCGYNFNDTLVLYPFDGKMHKINCPKCGTEIDFTSPIFDIDEV